MKLSERLESLCISLMERADRVASRSPLPPHPTRTSFVVRFKGSHLQMPSRCACCLAPATIETSATGPIVNMGTFKYLAVLSSVPLCSRCDKHMNEPVDYWLKATTRVLLFMTVPSLLLAASVPIEVGPSSEAVPERRGPTWDETNSQARTRLLSRTTEYLLARLSFGLLPGRF
jgi:hypothetical protein